MTCDQATPALCTVGRASAVIIELPAAVTGPGAARAAGAAVPTTTRPATVRRTTAIRSSSRCAVDCALISGSSPRSATPRVISETPQPGDAPTDVIAAT